MSTFLPLEITLTGFGSFRHRQTFSFPKAPGLYFMRGSNLEEPRLGANGAGKSTIWKALCWVLWGKTATGLKAGDVSSWGIQKGTEVILTFEGALDGAENTYFLKRTWKPNSWTLANLFDRDPVDLVADGTNPVLAMLKLQFEPFLHSIYMAQRADMFLDLKPEPKAQLFSSVMGLDKWLDYSAKASASALDQDRISRKLESELAELKGKLEAHDSRDLEEEAERFEKGRRAALESYQKDHEEALRKSKEAKRELQEADDTEAIVFEAAKGLLDRLDQALKARDEASRRLRHSEDKVLGLKKDFDHAAAHCEKILNREECPTCGARPTERDQERLEREAKRAKEVALAALEVAQSFKESLRKVLDSVDAKFQRLDAECEDILEKRARASERLRSARIAYQSVEKLLDSIEDEAHRLESTKNPFHVMLQERKQGQDRIREEFQRVQAKLDYSYERHSFYTFWIRGFKDVRLRLISDALQELEIEVNSELMEVGLIGWEIRFDVDAETKKGGLTRGFSVSVLSPSNKDRVAWESWSGGESQRLRIAAQCGLANLIRSRTGCELPLEVWDEPTEGLSEEGITDLMHALSERAHRERRTIWVVDHRALGFGGFADTVTVVKDAKGSHVVQSWYS